jgi:hypothetical protein
MDVVRISNNRKVVWHTSNLMASITPSVAVYIERIEVRILEERRTKSLIRRPNNEKAAPHMQKRTRAIV